MCHLCRAGNIQWGLSELSAAAENKSDEIQPKQGGQKQTYELKDANLRGVGESSLGLTLPVTHFTWSFYKIKIGISAC